jgi:predicted  nucleic acid-binding Zn-ribbon protein
MADEPENRTLRYLRSLDTKLDRVLGELKTRMDRLELNTGQIQVALAEHSNRMDRIENRLARIERRLDLVDTPSP